MPNRRVAFHLGHPFHASMLGPVYEQVRHTIPALLSESVNEVVDFAPKVLVLADSHYHLFRERLPNTPIVWTRHGFSNKKIFENALSGCDFACVSSDWVIEDALKRGVQPRLGFWKTGFVPMDKALKPQSCGSIRESLFPGCSERGSVLLYAPTFNHKLSAHPVVGTSWIGRALTENEGLQIVIKPHPVMPERSPEWFLEFKRCEAEFPGRVRVIEDSHSDVYSLFPVIDVLLTDASSVMFYFLAFDKPILLVNNPNRFDDDEGFSPSAPEWSFRDMGEQVERSDALLRGISTALTSPEIRSEKRRFYRERVFGDLLDGESAYRVAAQVQELVESQAMEIKESWLRFERLQQLEAENQSLTLALQDERWRSNHFLNDIQALKDEIERRDLELGEYVKLVEVLQDRLSNGQGLKGLVRNLLARRQAHLSHGEGS